MLTKPTVLGLGILLAAGSASPVLPAECGLCAKSVVVNSALATCFLEKYPQLVNRSNGAVAIDLAECAEEDRSVVPALRGPHALTAETPSLRFILSLQQLACLKRKLEEPGVVLDPSAKIDLESCE
jgi:hypothetical protein